MGYDPYNSFKFFNNRLYGRMIMRKCDEIEQPASCLNKAAADEPVFVLRAKDPIAPALIEDWAKHAEMMGIHEPAKIAEARALAQSMREWRTLRVGNNRPRAQAEAANKFEG